MSPQQCQLMGVLAARPLPLDVFLSFSFREEDQPEAAGPVELIKLVLF